MGELCKTFRESQSKIWDITWKKFLQTVQLILCSIKSHRFNLESVQFQMIQQHKMNETVKRRPLNFSGLSNIRKYTIFFLWHSDCFQQWITLMKDLTLWTHGPDISYPSTVILCLEDMESCSFCVHIYIFLCSYFIGVFC